MLRRRTRLPLPGSGFSSKVSLSFFMKMAPSRLPPWLTRSGWEGSYPSTLITSCHCCRGETEWIWLLSDAPSVPLHTSTIGRSTCFGRGSGTLATARCQPKQPPPFRSRPHDG